MTSFFRTHFVVLVSCFGFAASASASCEKETCEGVTNAVVTSIKASENGTFITFPTGTDLALDCALVEGQSALLEKSHPEYKSAHSLLLTAIASNLPVKITFSVNTPSCSISSVELKVAL
jgi:hypothetical protein